MLLYVFACFPIVARRLGPGIAADDELVSVQIIGAPVACAEGVKDTWREVAAWAAGRLTASFGEAIQVHYFDLFDPACPPFPSAAQLPLVVINGEVLTSGGKISIPAIRRRIETLGLHANGG